MAKFFLRNPGFELGDTGWKSLTDASIINDAVNSRSGDWTLRLIGASTTRHILGDPDLAFRPGGRLIIKAWFKDGSGGGNAFVRADLRDQLGADIGNGTAGNQIAPGSGSYAQSTIDEIITTSNLKFINVGLWFASPAGTWYADDVEASGDFIEAIPSTATIASYRIVPADTIGVFDPLIGADKFTEFNAGMSDKWAGVYTFIPSLGADLGELVSFIRRLGRTERFFAFDPDRTIPLNGIVNGMTVDGPITNGTNKISVKAGPVSSTALVAGDYMEVKDQYFQLQRDLEIGPEGTGEAIVWPAVRSTLADGEDVITNNPKMVARITSDLDWRRIEARPVDLTIAWEEV